MSQITLGPNARQYNPKQVEYVDNGTVFGQLVSNLEVADKTRRLLTLRVKEPLIKSWSRVVYV